MTGTRTPGRRYALRQDPSTLFWQVVPVDEAQALAMRARGEPHVYDAAAQARAVQARLNLARGPRSSLVETVAYQRVLDLTEE